MRPTLDGLNASQWFTVARVGAEFLLAAVLLWFVGRCVRRGLAHIADARRRKRERERERRWRAAPGSQYRGGSTVRTPWPTNDR